VQPNGSSLTVGNWQLPPAVWVQPGNGGFVYVGDRWYRGRVLLVSQGSSLLAVNYVDFEHYLYSVVGSEMHANAPAEALKAQAIAARSYALVHMIRPASSWYHLGNTQRWQVYKGLSSEYNTGQQAVDATAGQILSYQGGVVESLYAATDEIVSRAHGGRGMSQTGAYELAKQGNDYQAILSYYYPGVGLARLVLQ
jgi:peptidoglycan hydrolase-like amidase